ncbi:DUF4159 domain-containing protein [Tranquillimonas rosea]|uniref:DUF4159 domain-containing protein n=1 Tax=Tranquillimonas rosea TaxID=641238 RepID=UPI003BAA6156
MFTLFGIGFTTPWLLLGLVALPILWLLLRAVPPAPVRRRFPGVALLLGLSDDDQQSDKTPWWLLLLRTLAVAAVILGFAGPVLNPEPERAGSGPLLVLLDGTWADAGDWPRRMDRAEAVLSEAARQGRTAAVVSLTDLPEGPVPFQAADAWAGRLPSIQPRPWVPQEDAVAEWGGALDGAFETFWLSDGVDRPWRDDLLADLEDHGGVTVFESPRSVTGLRPARFEDGAVQLSALRVAPGPEREIGVTGHGTDPNGIERALVTATLPFAQGATEAEASLSVPPELRNRITRFELDAVRSAAAVSLTDDALQRREVALVAGRDDREGLELLSPTHYLEEALEPTADLIDGAMDDVMQANPDAIILADVAQVSRAEELLEWVEGGGLLVRFAGPRLAASDVSRSEEDPLMPVRLRAGGRSVGGAMSWGEPKGLRDFQEDSPFAGLSVPEDVSVNAQVMAQPDPTLSDRVIASLEDGTPLVTRKRVGEGQIVLFHVSANAEWSTLPLSGLFVQMLERLAVSTRPARPDAADLEGTVWEPDTVLTAFGDLQDAGTLPGIDGAALAEARPGPETPPGLYRGEDRRVSLNVIGAETTLAPTAWPDRIPVEGLDIVRETALKGWLLTLALGLMALDVLAALALAGRLRGPRAGAGAAAALVLALAAVPQPGTAQEIERAETDDPPLALEATTEVVLAHVVTGNDRLDETAHAGLRGLSRTLFQRTSIEPAAPIAVDLETDELAFFPFLYWPVDADQPIPSDEAYAKLNTYLRTGGMILFDTRDADVAGYGASTDTGRKLQRLAGPLDIPPLEPVPEDHVLTRTFYLLQDFPGRYAGADVWVEAAPADAEQVEGMPFRDLNDNVTPVVIGGNDWAAAWAVDDSGSALFPVGRGYAGERQREIAMRFGVNLIMHVLTGNYKSDQVHVPALLDRLGQ